jgi:hypothetical protein
MLNPDHSMLARVLYEERVAEALQQHRHHRLRTAQFNRLTRLLLNLGNRLVDLGQKLKTQAVVTPPTEPVVG